MIPFPLEISVRVGIGPSGDRRYHLAVRHDEKPGLQLWAWSERPDLAGALGEWLAGLLRGLPGPVNDGKDRL